MLNCMRQNGLLAKPITRCRQNTEAQNSTWLVTEYHPTVSRLGQTAFFIGSHNKEILCMPDESPSVCHCIQMLGTMLKVSSVTSRPYSSSTCFVDTNLDSFNKHKSHKACTSFYTKLTRSEQFASLCVPLNKFPPFQSWVKQVQHVVENRAEAYLLATSLRCIGMYKWSFHLLIGSCTTIHN